MTTCPPYPLRFEPIYMEKVWGGRTLEQLGRVLPDPATRPIGESWELADLAATSASGAGGAAVQSRVANGPMQGKTLGEVITAWGRDLTGDLPWSSQHCWPLLVKYLDAHEHLSVQVHPSPAYAAAHPQAHLKSEAWYVVAAQPDAAIYKGLQPGTTPQRLQAALTDGSPEAVLELLVRVEVQAGDCHYLPSGTCHALGAGVLAAEIQTPSDTTFRVYDWGRQGRQLHIDQAMACIDFSTAPAQSAPALVVPGRGCARRTLVRCDFFHWDELTLAAGFSQNLTLDQPLIWMVLDGAGTLETSVGRMTLGRGETWLLPAGLSNVDQQTDQGLTLLEARLPGASPPRLA